MTDHDYDYVIIGGGTAGCVLAARLSEDPAARVLLLEAGPAQPSEAAGVPAAWPSLIGSDAEWGSVTVAQAGAGALPYPRGRGLGGSGAINAMAHIRGHRAVYDGWAAAGADGWGFDQLLPYFQRSEDAGSGRDPALRGTGGLVRVAPVPEASRHPAARAFAEALCAAGFPATDDLSGRQQEGVAWPDLAIAEGRRVSPAGAYLSPALGRANLTVMTGCLVTRLTISGGRCAGAEYVRDGKPGRAHASAEVIVCAGAIGSPQLLLLSGIGPAAQLRALGINPVADLPGVRENLQDHPFAMTCYASHRADGLQQLQPRGEPTPRCRSPGMAGDWPRSAAVPDPDARSRRAAALPRPGASPWRPAWSPPTAAAPSGWPPPTRRRHR